MLRDVAESLARHLVMAASSGVMRIRRAQQRSRGPGPRANGIAPRRVRPLGSQLQLLDGRSAILAGELLAALGYFNGTLTDLLDPPPCPRQFLAQVIGLLRASHTYTLTRDRYDRMVTELAPAAGPLRLVQSLAGTLSADADTLGTREGAVSWLRAAGLMPADALISSSEHGALLRLRDAVRDALAAHAAGRPDADVAARLTRALADGRLVVTITQAGAVQLATAARSVYPSIVAAIAVAIAESDAAGEWPPKSATA